MYLRHWGLRERPFQNTFNAAFLYHFPAHDEVLSRLRYNLEGGRGLVVVTGPTGCGKSFLARAFAEDSQGKGARVCLIVNPIDDPEELLHQIRVGLGIEEPAHTRAGLIRSIEEAALATYRRDERLAIIVDDAHLLTDPAIGRELRHLLNMEERGTALVNLILVGQDTPEGDIHEQDLLAQRIGIRCSVSALPEDEIGGYITHRMKVAGAEVNPFGDDAVDMIVSISKGSPRVINNLCDVALFSAWGKEKTRITSPDMQDVISEFVQAEDPSE